MAFPLIIKVNLVPYPGELDDVLPLRNPTSKGWEDQLAAKVMFRRTDNPFRSFPSHWHHFRAPYMVTFKEISSKKRILSLFAIHAPPDRWPAMNYLNDLGYVYEISKPVGDNEVRAVFGDFNVNYFTILGKPNSSYSSLTNNTFYNPPIRYTSELTGGYGTNPPKQVPSGTDHDQIKGYYGTLIRSLDNAKIWSTVNHEVFYPGYDYFNWDENIYSIDNIFTRYGTNGQKPNAPEFTIINPIVASPYTKYHRPAGVNPGTTIYPHCLEIFPNGSPPRVGKSNSTIGYYTKFRSWDNYAVIRSVSDHLPLSVVL